tara:strand:- start:123 stop:338 length:216 start_codon:yes stop_codon:yes gene_type:complete
LIQLKLNTTNLKQIKIMETLIIILCITIALCGIFISYLVGKNNGAKEIKTTLNNMTIRQMIANKRDKFKSI